MGCKVITAKWVDTNKGDTSRPNFRTRLVGREVKYDKRLDLFSATPSMETLKLMCSMCARGQTGLEPYRLAVIDIKRAYFYAPARRPIFIEIPKEDLELGDEGCVGQLQLSLHVTRDAAQNWAHEYTSFLLSFGFQVGRASPCKFTHRTRRVHLTVHGDEFTVVASAKQIAWLGEAMKKRYELKMEVLGPSAGQTEEVRVLNRATRREDHFRVGLGNVQVSVHTSRAGKRVSDKSDDSRRRGNGRQRSSCSFRALAARLNYLAGDRPDLLFASKCICKSMARPGSEDWLALKRVGRYLKGATRMVPQFHWAGDGTNLHGYADSDWAGDRQNMKSTSGGVIMWSGHCIKAWSTSQSALALSSGEAEDKSGSSAQWRNRHWQRLWRELDRSCEIRLQQCNRNSSQRWFGRSVPIYQGAVFLDPVKDQEWRSQVTIQKVLGTNNVADAMTKAVDRWALDKYMAAMNCILMPGSSLAHLHERPRFYLDRGRSVKIQPMC